MAFARTNVIHNSDMKCKQTEMMIFLMLLFIDGFQLWAIKQFIEHVNL